MFITVLHGENQRNLFNTQCKTVVLLNWIKVKCGCEHDATIDLANLDGQVMHLPQQQSAVASDVLTQREEYILISISQAGDPSNPVYTSLLHNCDLNDSYCLAKLREAKEEACKSAENSRKLTSSLSTESQTRPYKQIRFSSVSN